MDATLTGAQTVYEHTAPRAAWLHVIRDADPDYPWRGVSPLQRAAVSSQLVRMAEDALVTELNMPTKAMFPMPQGAKVDTDTLRSDFQNKAYQVVFPTTVVAGFGAGRSSAPLTDWKPQRLKPMPEDGAGAAGRQRDGARRGCARGAPGDHGRWRWERER